MKAIFQILVLTMLPAMLWAQVTPSEYESALAAVRERVKIQLAEGWDVVLPPEEQVGLLPNSLTLAVGNWGPDYLKVNANYSAIKSRLQRKVAVFILDTGDGYAGNPALDKCAWNEEGRDFTGAGADKKDNHGHSTHCAGIVGAWDASTPLGVARMMSEAGMLKVIPYQVLSDQGSGSFAWITAGTLAMIDRAKQLQAQGWFVVASFSLGGGSESPDMEAALKKAQDAGIYVVCANGNTGGTPVQYPGRSAYVSGIAALQQTASGVDRAPYSSYGPQTFQALPGSLILSTYKGGLASLSGTSMATPHEAGVVAILASIYPGATAAQLKAFLAKWSADLGATGKDDLYGYGAPVIIPYLTNTPDGIAPPPPPPDTSQREKRTLTFTLLNYSTIYREYSKAENRKLFFDLDVSCETTALDEAIADKVKTATGDYFSRVGFVLPDKSGYNDAAFWVRHFYEMQLKSLYGLTVLVEEIRFTDQEGRKGVINKTARYKPTTTNRYLMPAATISGKTTRYKKKGLW
jgi:hypothetical protein